MFLKSLSIVNFKNYTGADIQLSTRINCFVGSNGEGKTNLLDAVHYLSFCKSYFNPIDSQNILHDAPFFVIQGVFELEGSNDEIYCGLKRNQKKQFKRNKKEYERLADHIGLIPLVMISPSDSDLINEGSESRRRFIDSVISQFDKDYLNNLIDYNKALAQRNALLKSFRNKKTIDHESIEIWDAKLVEFGAKIHHSRKEFIVSFAPLFQNYFEKISGGKEIVSLSYSSQLSEGDFAKMLVEKFERDRILEYTTTGIHKDDLEFLISGFPIKKYGSQGQQKSYLIALKLAQFEFIKKIKNIVPILLLDDVYDKLDDIRIKALVEIVSSKDFGQIFITDTSEQRMKKLFDENEDVRIFKIKAGVVKE